MQLGIVDERFSSRRDDGFANQILSAMRYAFGATKNGPRVPHNDHSSSSR